MKGNFRIFTAVVVLCLAVLACQTASGEEKPNSNNPSRIDTASPAISDTPIPDPTEPPGTSDLLLSDDFSSSHWGTGTDANRSVEYVNETLRFTIFRRNWFMWSTPNTTTYEDIHMEVTVSNYGTDIDTTVGFICDKSAGENNFYYLAMTLAGQYVIAKAVDGQNDLFLTNNDEWGDSDLIPQSASSYRIGADCGNGRLTLYVNENEIASVSDSSYVSGEVALFAWSGEAPDYTTNVSFDDFVMTALP